MVVCGVVFVLWSLCGWSSRPEREATGRVSLFSSIVLGHSDSHDVNSGSGGELHHEVDSDWTSASRTQGDAYRRCVYWICDYHYSLSGFTLYYVCSLTRLWNLVFLLHGADIDLASVVVYMTTVPPSKADLIRLRRPYLSSSCSIKGKAEIMESNLGYAVELSDGVKVHRSIIPPQS